MLVWGLVPHIEHVADRFSGGGVRCPGARPVPRAESAKGPDQAGKLMMALHIDQAARDLAVAIDHLAGQRDVTDKKVGTVGFCKSGALSLFAASCNPEVGACVIFYGGHPNVKPDLRSLQAAVLGLYAGKDAFVTPESAKELGRQLRPLGKRYDFHTYPLAQHAFFNDERPDVYDAAAAADAWAKTIAFFRRELQE